MRPGCIWLWGELARPRLSGRSSGETSTTCLPGRRAIRGPHRCDAGPLSAGWRGRGRGLDVGGARRMEPCAEKRCYIPDGEGQRRAHLVMKGWDVTRGAGRPGHGASTHGFMGLALCPLLSVTAAPCRSPVPGLALCPPPQALVGGSDSRPAAQSAGRVTRHIQGGWTLNKGEKGAYGGQGHPGPGRPSKGSGLLQPEDVAGGDGFGGQHQPPGAPGQLEASSPAARGW